MSSFLSYYNAFGLASSFVHILFIISTPISSLQKKTDAGRLNNGIKDFRQGQVYCIHTNDKSFTSLCFVNIEIPVLFFFLLEKTPIQKGDKTI